MTENQPQKRTRGVFVVAVTLLALIPTLYLWLTPSAEEQLRALDMERAIPDEENAAFQYARVFKMFDVDLGHPGILDFGDANELKVRTLPWRSADYPEVAKWLEENQPLIHELLAIGQMEKCVFPLMEDNDALPVISVFSTVSPYLSAFRQWAFLLKYAVYNDLGEGRQAEAIDKAQTIVRMGNHLRQQPITMCLLVGISLDALGVGALNQYIVTGEVSNADLDRLTLDFGTIEGEYMRLYQETLRTDPLIDPLIDRHVSSQSPPLERLRTWLLYLGDDLDRKLDMFVHQSLSGLRELSVLIELRRHKNRTGQWPTGLDQIAPALPEEALVDPFSNKPFVYRQLDDSFVLYCLGENGVDEKGQYSWGYTKNPDEPDDWPIWPRFYSPAYEAWQKANSP